MFRNFAKVSGVLILLLLANFMGCGDADKVGEIPAEELLQISSVLDRWREGYETEDVNTYINTFWEDGFLYVSDMEQTAIKQTTLSLMISERNAPLPLASLSGSKILR